MQVNLTCGIGAWPWNPGRNRDNCLRGRIRANYVRGCAGTVTAAHGGFAFADAQARGHHDIAEHLYTVRFEAAEV